MRRSSRDTQRCVDCATKKKAIGRKQRKTVMSICERGLWPMVVVPIDIAERHAANTADI